MKAPVYVLTQNAQPGMLIEVDGERYLVLAVDTDFPTVRYSTPTGMERVEYGAEARVVTISGHPAALPASSVVYAVSRDDREAVEARTETYVAAVKAAVVDPTFDVTTLGLRQTCTECNVHVDRMTEAERAAHEIIDMEVEWFSPWVIVGCEGYWMVNPTAVGMELGNWQDWREIHCGDCAATLAQHCVECNECPMTDGPCWCGAASYKSEGRPAKAAEAHEHFEGCPWVEGGTETCDCAEPAQIASEAPGGTDAPQTPAEPAATSPQGRAALLAAMVAETMTIPTEVRYARAYGVLSGLVRGLLTDTHRIEMAQSYVEQLDEAIAAEHR